MKNLRTLLLILFALITLNSDAQLSGKIPLMANKIWTLTNRSNLNLKIKGDKLGYFKVDISKLESGIYDFGEMGEIFLEPGYKTNINFANKQYILIGDGALENKILAQTRQGLDQFLGNPGYAVKFNYLLTEPSIFIPLLDKYVEHIKSKSEQSTDNVFKDFIKQEAAFGKRYCLYAYNRFYGLDSSKMDALKEILSIPVKDRNGDFSKQLKEAYQVQFSKKLIPEEKELLNKITYNDWDINNELLYKNSSYYKNMISYRIDYLTYLPENRKLIDSLKNDNIIKLNVAKNLLSNSKIKEDFIFTYTNASIKAAKMPTEVSTIYESFINGSTNESHKSEVKKSFQNLSTTLSNFVSPEFNYTTPDGKMVSLKSLRGKYVYIDVWATWCAPCVAEIPSLKKLEQDYTNKKIQFVSISVDKKEQKKQWLDFVKKNNLKGIQLMADNDFKSDFIKKFGISTIPRFILIGPDGLIIDNNAKRPSDIELGKQLNTFKL